MTIRVLDAEIVRLYELEKVPIRTISGLLGVHHSVVERVLRKYGLLPPRPESGKPRKRSRMIDRFLPFIDETLQRYPTLPASVLHRIVVQRGYRGAESHFRALIAQRRPKPPSEAFLRLQTLPGEQSQVDWASCGVWPVPSGTGPTSGFGERRLSAFLMVLPYSRMPFVRFAFDQQMGSWLESHNAAFAFFGGVTRSVLYDNLKTAVLERVGSAKRFHPTMLEMAAWYRFEAHPVGVRKPEQKGAVERAVRYLKDSFLPQLDVLGLRGCSLTRLNELVLTWCIEVAGARPWRRDCRALTVKDAFEKEKEHLTALPAEAFPAATETPVHVGKQPYFRFDRNEYSVPHTAVRRTLLVRADSLRVRVFDGVDLVAEHQRSWGVRQLIEKPEHVERLKRAKRRARRHSAQERLLKAVPAAETFLMELSKRQRRLYRSLAQMEGMLDTFGAQEMQAALTEAIDSDTASISSVQLILDRRRHAASKEPRCAIDLPDDPRIAHLNVKQHDLSSYDLLNPSHRKKAVPAASDEDDSSENTTTSGNATEENTP